MVKWYLLTRRAQSGFRLAVESWASDLPQGLPSLYDIVSAAPAVCTGTIRVLCRPGPAGTLVDTPGRERFTRFHKKNGAVSTLRAVRGGLLFQLASTKRSREGGGGGTVITHLPLQNLSCSSSKKVAVVRQSVGAVLKGIGAWCVVAGYDTANKVQPTLALWRPLARCRFPG